MQIFWLFNENQVLLNGNWIFMSLIHGYWSSEHLFSTGWRFTSLHKWHNWFIETEIFWAKISGNWTPRSCNLTPLDYFLWGYVKARSIKIIHNRWMKLFVSSLRYSDQEKRYGKEGNGGPGFKYWVSSGQRVVEARDGKAAIYCI